MYSALSCFRIIAYSLIAMTCNLWPGYIGKVIRYEHEFDALMLL